MADIVEEESVEEESCVPVIRFANTVSWSNQHLLGLRDKKSCCPLCVKSPAKENLREVKFYTKSDGLSQHCCVIHHVHGTLSDEVLQQANEFSKVLVYRETLESIKDLSKARERDNNNGTNYKKCIVKCDGDGDDELELFGVSEKEAAKLFSLCLFHKGIIHSIENKDNSTKVSVVSSEKEIDFLVWGGGGGGISYIWKYAIVDW